MELRFWAVVILVVWMNLPSMCYAECDRDSDDSCITVSSTSPVTLETPIWFSVLVHNYVLDLDEILYYSVDDGLFNQNDFQGSTLQHTWNFTYDKLRYRRYTGYHTAQITVYKKSLFLWHLLDSSSLTYFITDGLSGRVIIQPNVTVKNDNDDLTVYIATGNHTNLTAVVHDPNYYIMNHTLDVEFYWMINQQMVGSCITPSIVTNITKPGRYLIEVNVVVDMGNPIPTTTTAIPNTTTTTTATTIPPKSLYDHDLHELENSLAESPLSNRTGKQLQYNSENNPAIENYSDPNTTTSTTTSTTTTTTTPKPTPPRPTPPPTPPPTPTPDGFKCDGVWPGGSLPDGPLLSTAVSFSSAAFSYSAEFSTMPLNVTKNNSSASGHLLGNGTAVHSPMLNLGQQSLPGLMQQKIVFGTFSKTVEAKDSIRHVNVTGNTWLRHGELTNLTVSCDGSGDWDFCWEYREGVHNVTGKERCEDPAPLSGRCTFSILYLLQTGTTYTFVIIIDNGVSHTVTPIGINIYKQQPPRQLFRVLMPVATTCLVFVFLVFAVGLYIRKRRSYIVEVADFDFVGSTSGTSDVTASLAGVSFWAHVVWAIKRKLAEGASDDDNYRRYPRYVEQPSILDEDND